MTTIYLEVCLQVEVVILDKNDSPPEFKNIPPAYFASEDLAPGQLIATIVAEDPDTIGTTAYNPLDRETTAEYQIVIRADDGMQFTDVTIVIQVTDTNDNPPVFKEGAYSFDIAENAARGSVVGVVAATDLDAGPNAQITYTLISDWANDVFSLNPQTGVFTLTARLDYEDTQHYILVAQAQDNGHPSLSGTVTVYVNVIDLNDNAPIFDPMSFSNEILENVPVGSSVVTVSATEMDSGLNGKLQYSITSGDESHDFSIATNGTIYTARLLDRETVPVYNLIVTARDSAKPPEPQLSSTVQVTIQLKDVNDVAPEFITPNVTTISENIPLNTVVMTVKAVDKDEGRNGYVEYFMTPNPEVNGYFSLGNVDGVLRATGKLDRELRPSYTITVTAKDRGDPPNMTKMKIKIIILDENDNSPVFDPKQYSASVPENASIGASVLQVSATDIDEDANGRVRYSIISGDENRDFSVSEDTGVVRVAKNLNFERKSRYQLTIRAEDCAKDDVRFDTAELSISIQDINDNPPTFLDSPYLAYVMENVIPPNGGYIITIHAYDADSPPFNNQVRYFIKEGDADLFKINASSGQISLLRTLDREAQDEYTLALVAMDTGSPPLTGSGTVKIIVQDINDNSPEFERQSYKTNVKENLPSGTVILHPKATDKDVGNNAKIRYSLLGDKSDRFEIDSATGVISTNSTLDREEWNIYYLIIMAQDSSTTDPRTATANLTIIVDDENDNTPTFAQPVYEAYISERTVVGDFVFGARAKDNDIGLNQKIIYDLKGEHQDLFSISKDTGVIKAKENLTKYKQTNGASFNLIIVATDSGTNPRQSTAELILIPKSVKNFPKFTIANKLTFTFSEDTPEGVLVTRLSATSPKKGPTGLLQYAIAGGNVGDALRIESMSGEIFITGKGLDYETMPLYEVWFEVRDSDNPPLKSFIEIEIKVTDANDNPPIIENALYNATVMEEESPPQLVIKIEAHDEDSNENGRISYKLVNDYEETFLIDSETGEIFTNIALDRESIPFYEIIVEAIDHGVPQLVGTSTVIVTVLDKNDNPPRFTRLFSVNVTENAEIGSFVIKVTSSDLDTGPNANATYSFVENPGEKFTIDPISGNVTVARPLDRELQDEYILKVAAIDGAWRSETPLTITIQDQNDNAPEFEYSFYSFNFPELQKKNSFVGQVIATDRDKQGPNSIISYSLQQSSDLFAIDPATGEILSKFTMKYKRTSVNTSPENSYSVIVVATDNGKPPMSSECLVTINVVDANNNSPKFKGHENFVPVPKDATLGEKIIKLTAEDNMDYGINAEIEYYVSGGNGTAYFTIDKNTGWVVVNKQFYYIGQYYVLKVKAVDRGVPPQSDETTMTFIVTGENMYSPKFTALSYQVIVPENEPIGSSILTVKATDEDIGPNGIVRYSISSGNTGAEFQIHPISGAISILRALDFDTIQEYRLNITAKDLGFKSKETTATLTIILTDINDNAPQFNQTSFIAYLPENSPVNSFVYQVTAVDIDSPKNAIIRYYINNKEMTSLFHIDANTGEIYSRDVFDFEEKSIYKLQISAENPGSAMKNKTEVVVHITGVNEYFPKFIQPVFHFDVSESADVGTNVGVIQATDQDSGDDGIIYYLFVGSSNDKGFSINSQTGVIRVARYLDRETQNRVVLTVLAKNSGGIRGNDTDEAQVIISIQDGNDPPEFSRHYYEATVSEDAKIGQEVIQVKAEDKDVRPQNNQFSFSIISGNNNQDFKIDPQSGNIEVARYLDRETSPIYSLIIGAIDTGIPPQTGTATVKISLTDVNDNGPLFDVAGFDGSVYENEPPNTHIATLSAKDPDLPPNGAPFSYAIIGGKHQSYVKVQRHTGVLLTTRKIDRELTPYLEIVIQIEDSGVPVMRSNYTISIKVLDRNDNPPTPRSAHVLVYAFNNKVPSGKIADVKPNDPDTTGDYRCRMIEESTSENTLALLHIRKGCDLFTSDVKPGQGYSFSVSGNDGIHRDVTDLWVSTVKSDKIHVHLIHVAMVDNVENKVMILLVRAHHAEKGRLTGGRSDFIAIELLGGKPIFSFGGARTSITSVAIMHPSKNLADGGWYKLTATRNGRVISLSVATCTDHGDVCTECEPGDTSCYKDDTGQAGTLNFNHEPLLIGGLHKADPVLERPGQIHSDDFVGCMHSISINGRQLNLSNPIRSRGVEPNCERTRRKDGILFYAATDKYYTLIELLQGKVSYSSKQNTVVNMTQTEQDDVSDGEWHNITLFSLGRSIRLIVDGKNIGEELDSAGVHDFLDPYLTTIALGGVKSEWVYGSSNNKFEGCLSNFSINNELQPFGGNGSIFKETLRTGKILTGCHSSLAVGLAQNPDPLSIGITLVIVFFIILIVAILVSFVVFRLRKQKKEKGNNSTSKASMVHTKQNGGPAMLNAPNLIAGTNDSIMNRSLHGNETNLNSYMSDNADIMRNVGHIVGPELLSKKYKDREILNIPQRPDIIEREVVGKSPALREDHHPPPPPSTNTSHHTHDHPSGMDLNSEVPEHYDLENASSIAPSDIDIVYHYKGFREAAGVRKYKATPPPIAGYHHKHQTPQHRHSPHHPSGYPPRVLPQASQPPPQPRQHQTTPLARLSPSSELSQQPRILTLHDISGKPLQSALLATTSSSGGVGKDVLHSNSERSLNSPVMSQLSGQSSSAGRKTPSAPPQVPQVGSVGSGAVGLTAEEIERMNARQRTSSLVSTLDAVSSSSEAPRGGGVGHHMSHRHHSPQGDNRSSTGSDDESGNDSFTCSEIEYDNNSINADKSEDVRRQNVSSGSNTKKPILPPPYESFDSSFRGSLSTLVASDDDLAPHVGSALYRQANGSPAPATLGWDYLLNWGPNFESMIGVFKDIAELPDTVNGRMSSTLRLPNGTPKPSEEYV
ncbi:cadherin domain-containing protein [Phthorimaea operculella]|nr:cadherin domain-containing protein [Phthorimaea operculella]